MTADFAFAQYAHDFDEHIGRSIPGLDVLRGMVVDLSRTFVQPRTTVLDIGCSTGTLLKAIHDANYGQRQAVQYVGLDVERKFESHWKNHGVSNITFRLGDVRTWDGFKDVSLATSLFTIQFVPEGDRLQVLRRIHDGLLEGGALIIAEKVLAATARFQDLLLGPYYDFKRANFTAAEILDKERGLRASMRLMAEPDLLELLAASGFGVQEIHRFWQSYLFVAFVAVKRSRPSEMRVARLKAA